MTHRTAWLLALLALAFGPGCVGSPQPSPPNLAPDGVFRAGDGNDIMDGVLVAGRPGAVSPPEGSVVAVNLDRLGPPVAEPVAADGSFGVIVEGDTEDEYRLQVRNGGARSAPLDVVGQRAAIGFVPAPRPLADCLTLAPAAELDFGDVPVGAPVVETVVITNDCGEEVILSATLRDPTAPFDLTLDRTSVPAGEVAQLSVRARPAAAGSVEAIAFVTAVSPSLDRRPLTLFVRGTD